MNIFAVHANPKAAARALCDRHVVKMTLETAQILCAVAHLNGHEPPYRPTHLRHPCVLWAAERHANWAWLVEHGLALAEEFRRRYGKDHKSGAVILWARTAKAGPNRDGKRRSPFVQTMPEEYRGKDPVQAYRRMYVGEKARFASWRDPARPPSWWVAPRRGRGPRLGVA